MLALVPGTVYRGRYEEWMTVMGRRRKRRRMDDRGDGDDEGDNEGSPWLTAKLNCIYFSGSGSSPARPHSFQGSH